jgi:two-component system, NarL family, response regulator NreC
MLLESEPDFHVVAETDTVTGVLQQVRTHRPQVLLLDLNMPGGSSIEAIGRIGMFAPETVVVVLTMEDRRSFIEEAYAAGASGYVLKEAAPDTLVRTIRRSVEPGRDAMPTQPPP